MRTQPASEKSALLPPKAFPAALAGHIDELKLTGDQRALLLAWPEALGRLESLLGDGQSIICGRQPAPAVYSSEIGWMLRSGGASALDLHRAADDLCYCGAIDQALGLVAAATTSEFYDPADRATFLSRCIALSDYGAKSHDDILQGVAGQAQAFLRYGDVPQTDRTAWSSWLADKAPRGNSAAAAMPTRRFVESAVKAAHGYCANVFTRPRGTAALVTLLRKATELGDGPIQKVVADALQGLAAQDPDGRVAAALKLHCPDLVQLPRQHLLLDAIRTGDLPKLNTALAAAAFDVNAPLGSHGEPPLVLACQAGRPEVVTWLVARSANLEAAFEHAHQKRDFETGAALARKMSGKTAIVYASRVGDLDLIGALIRAGADIHQQDSEGRTPMYVACATGRLRVAQFLLNQGGDINDPGGRAYTPLHAACINGEVETVRWMLASGADLRSLMISAQEAAERGPVATRAQISELVANHAANSAQPTS